MYSRPWHKLGLSSLANAKALVADGTGPFHHAGACMWLISQPEKQNYLYFLQSSHFVMPQMFTGTSPTHTLPHEESAQAYFSWYKNSIIFWGDLVLFTHFCFLYAVCSFTGVTFSSWSWKILSLDQRKQWAVQHCHMGLMKCTSWHLTGQRLSQSLITC